MIPPQQKTWYYFGCLGTTGQDRNGTRLDFRTNGKAVSQHEDLIMEVPTRGSGYAP